MADRTYECDTGFLITQDEEGNYLPFLLKVLARNIIWSSSGSSSIEDALLDEDFINLLRIAGVNRIIQINPTPSYRFEYKGWNCRIDQLYHVTFIKEITMEDLVKRMHLVDIDQELTVGMVINPSGYEEAGDDDEVRLTDQTIIRHECRYYTVNIPVPFAVVRDGFHVSTTFNQLEEEYKKTNFDIQLEESSIIENFKLAVRIEGGPQIEDTPVDDEGAGDNSYDRDGIVVPSVEYGPDEGLSDDPESIVFVEDIVEVMEDPYGLTDDPVLVFKYIEPAPEPEPIPKTSSVLIRIEGELYQPENYIPDDMIPEPIILDPWPEEGDEENPEDDDDNEP